MALCNRAVEHNIAAFLELSLVKLLTPAGMMDNLSKRTDGPVSANSGSMSIVN